MPSAESLGLVHDVSSSLADVDNCHPVQHEPPFRQIVEGISALVSCLTPNGAVDFVNRQVLDYFGKTLEELKEWASTDAIHPDELPGAIAAWKRALESGQAYSVEVRQRRADGVYRWFRVQGLPVRDPEGRIMRWCVLQTDIEERKRTEEALRESARELRQLVNSVPGMISVADSTGQLAYANERLLDYTGTTVEELKDLGFSNDSPGRARDVEERVAAVYRTRTADGL